MLPVLAGGPDVSSIDPPAISHTPARAAGGLVERGAP